MKTFKNKPKIKIMLLEEIKKHRELDEIKQGAYGGQTGPWCAVGCAIHSLNVRLKKTYSTGDHSVYEKELGIPRIIARLEDRIFEGLPSDLAKDYPYKFIESVGVGKDLSLVWPKFAVWLLTDEKDGVINHAKTDQTKKAITDVSALYNRIIKGEIVGITEWRASQAAAYAAYAAADAAAYAYAAADAAAYAYAPAAYAAAAAAYAAYAAADAAAYAYAAADAAAYAADAAAYAAAYAYAAADAAYAARHKHYVKMADKLIEIIKES